MKSRGLAVLAWVPLALCVVLGIYLNVQYPQAVKGDPMLFMRAAVNAALDGHWSDLAILIFIVSGVSLALAIVFVNHMAKRPDLGLKVLWIVGALFLAPLVLPIYALKKL